jgi:hypothetical protein
MKQKLATGNPANGQARVTFGNACVASCQKILAQINRTKAAIFAESRHALRAPERLLRLALNEAEAVAWQTAYPHLVFPTLATEKVQAVVAWNKTQQSMRRANPVSALAT